MTRGLDERPTSAFGWVERERRYLPLDTLRAVAFGFVFLQHTLPGGLPVLGRSGVDLFFVLSGYLITGGLLRSRHGRGYFSRFYIRRTLRIFPAYYLTILAAVVVVPTTVLGMVPWTIPYLGNVGFTLGENQHSSLGHLWSLAVEEQFYLLWPLALWFVRSTAARWRLITAIVVAAPIIRAFLSETGWQAAYSLLPARMDGLAIGAGLALLQHVRGVEWFVRRRGRLLAAAVVSGGIFLAVGKLLVWPHPPHLVVVLSLSVICYGFVVAATIGFRDTWLEKAMSLRPVVYVGQISYGLYLIHVWVQAAVEQHTKSIPMVVGGTALITLVLAMASYHFFEKPINDQRHRFESPTSRPAEVAVRTS